MYIQKISILGGLLATAFFTATPALALPITVEEGSAAVTLAFNGFYNSSQITIPGLSAEITLSNFAFDYSSTFNWTRVQFDYSLTNTSTAPVLTSRVTNFAFNTTPTVRSMAPNSVTGVFDTVALNGNQPNGIGTMEFCITDVNCAGGGGGGVDLGQTGSGTIRIYFSGNQSELQFDNAVVRYQSVTCTTGSPCSGSASGIVTEDGGGEVPEPSTYALMSLGIAGIAMASRYSRKK
jgi:hypothetical protein